MNVAALVAVLVFALVLLGIVGLIYRGARASAQRGELDPEGLRVLRWAVAGLLVIYAILGLTAFLT